MRERVYCLDCGIEMQFHPVTSESPLKRAEDLLAGILDEFYACPACGKTAVPNENLFTQHALHVYACNLAVATELF